MGGITTSTEAATENVGNLKQVIKKTVKATKVARGSEPSKTNDAE